MFYCGLKKPDPMTVVMYFRKTIIENNHKLVEWKSGKQEKAEGFNASFRFRHSSRHL
jgi:hypothetical protein